MSTSSLLKKLVIVISILTFILFIALIIAASYMGLFSDVTITAETRGPYHAIVLPHSGAYRGIHQKIDSVMVGLTKHQINAIIAVGVYYDDPAKVAIADLRSEAGFIISDSIIIEPPFRSIKIPARRVLLAAITANPALAGFKTYPALKNWIEKNQIQVDTTQAIIERYLPDGLVEVELAITDTIGKP